MKIRRVVSGLVIAGMVLSSGAAFAMSTNEFDSGMQKGINYFNRQMYYEARDEFQWFADYNWGALSSGQQKYLLDYLDGSKAKIQAWESSYVYLTEEQAAEMLKEYLGGDLGTWVNGEPNYISRSGKYTVGNKEYYQMCIRGLVDNHSTALAWYVVAVDGSEIFPGLCRSGYIERY